MTKDRLEDIFRSVVAKPSVELIAAMIDGVEELYGDHRWIASIVCGLKSHLMAYEFIANLTGDEPGFEMKRGRSKIMTRGERYEIRYKGECVGLASADEVRRHSKGISYVASAIDLIRQEAHLRLVSHARSFAMRIQALIA